MEWEYKTISLDQFVNEKDELSIAEHLNEYGKEQWELVNIYEPKMQSYGYSNKLDESFMVFKRPTANV